MLSFLSILSLLVPFILSHKNINNLEQFLLSYERVSYLNRQEIKIAIRNETATALSRDQAYFLLLRLKQKIAEGIAKFQEHDELYRIRREISEKLEFPEDLKRIEELESLVAYHLEKPKWWSNVHFCTRYYGDVQGKYCSGPSPNCATVGSFTQLYHDWSRKAGGCHISWALFSMEPADDWFGKVELCFTHRPDGITKTCGNASTHATSETCRPVNEYLPYYYDHMPDKFGACLMSWKLSGNCFFLSLDFFSFYHYEIFCLGPQPGYTCSRFARKLTNSYEI